MRHTGVAALAIFRPGMGGGGGVCASATYDRLRRELESASRVLEPRKEMSQGRNVLRRSAVSSVPRWTLFVGAALLCALTRAQAHGISEESRETMTDAGVLEYIWLGAEHMVTGYDHLLFLAGVIFFLTGFRDIVWFITAFTIGHCITLLGATLAGVTANAYLIDAVIAVSVIYKGFENLDGFKKVFDIPAPNLLAMVFGFGLIHGFGLSTRLQELPLPDEGLIPRILAFNVGVELGQVAALTAMLGFFAAWRASKSFERFGRASNIALVLAGLGLFFFQMNGYFSDAHHDHHEEHGHAHHEEHGHAHHEEHGHAHRAADAARGHDAQHHAHDTRTEHKHTLDGHAHEHARKKATNHDHGEHTHKHSEDHAHGGEGHEHDKKPALDDGQKGHEHPHDHGEGHQH